MHAAKEVEKEAAAKEDTVESGKARLQQRKRRLNGRGGVKRGLLKHSVATGSMKTIPSLLHDIVRK